jgi:DnaJ domain
MILWLALGLILLAAALVFARVVLAMDPKAMAQAVRYAGAGLLGVGAAYFFFLGRIEAAMTLGAFALMAIGRWPGSIRGWRPAGSTGQDTKVETDYLRMVLDHESGQVEGTVLKGPYKGRRLAELGRAELLALHAECRVGDPQGATLLESYFDRTWGPDWRTEAGAGKTGAGAKGGAMSADEARAVLGVGPKATAEEIRDAYHRLMKKVHPDQGGSTYLASQLNAAKDVLLKD